MKDRHLISVDELRAAGALDVPASWRKSLGGKRELSTRLLWDDDAAADSDPSNAELSNAEPSNAHDPDAESAADEPE